jgi:hypothetical protein
LCSLTDFAVKSSMNLIVNILVRIATLPYYRLYHFNTVSPLEKIALLASMSPPEDPKILRAVSFWRTRKLAELQFITIAVRTVHTTPNTKLLELTRVSTSAPSWQPRS